MPCFKALHEGRVIVQCPLSAGCRRRSVRLGVPLSPQQARLQNSNHGKLPGSALRTTAERLASTVTAPSQGHQQAEQHAVEPAQFDFERQWYPLAFVEDLDPGRPHAVELLGKRLVLWRDASKEWRAFEDRCPHRLAPLSEGRIEEDGSLLCSYHGWRFQGDGTCTRIPQALDAKSEATARSSGRSCATAFPTQVRQGYLWVWGSGGSMAALESAAKAPLLIPNLNPDDTGQDIDGAPVMSAAHRYMRDVPYSWDVLVENFLDPSHVPNAHHGVQGNRYAELGGHFEISPTAPSDPLMPPGEEAMSMDVRSAAFGGRLMDFKIQFVPPCFIRYYIPSPMGGKVKWSQMPMYVVPSGPGRSRVLWWLCVDGRGLPAPVKLLMGLKPRWLEHVGTRNLVFDGDNIILHMQEKMLAADKEQGKTWKQAFYMPAPADRIVTAFRQWFDARAGGGPVPRPAFGADLGALGEPSREALLDRYNSHTRHCPACSRALAAAQALRWVASGAGILAALALAFFAGNPGRPSALAMAALVAAAAACAAAVPALNSLVQGFHFVDYVHQDKK